MITDGQLTVAVDYHALRNRLYGQDGAEVYATVMKFHIARSHIQICDQQHETAENRCGYEVYSNHFLIMVLKI